MTSTTYAIVETGGAITINNTGHINGNISVATATFNNEAYGTWTVAGTSVFGTGSSIVNDGTIDLHGGASISASGLGLTNHNEVDSWGTASVSGTIANTGTIEVHDGHLTLFGSLSGSGSVTVDVGATLEIEGTVSQTITLAGDGAHLQIDTSRSMARSRSCPRPTRSTCRPSNTVSAPARSMLPTLSLDRRCADRYRRRWPDHQPDADRRRLQQRPFRRQR